ncbi:MAG: butyrate kinase [Bacteroidales bacterium]
MVYRILTINPGSTSTKIAVFENETGLFVETINHTNEELSGFERVTDQYEFRKEAILSVLNKHDISLSSLSIIVGRGGLLKPIESGVYEVNQKMITDLRDVRIGEHASNLGGLIAANLAEESKSCKAYVADPVVVDELSPLARVTGHPLFKKISIFHALNHKAIARTYAASVGKEYNQLNLIVAHLGGGVSVGAHLKGKVVEVNNALNGEGPFSPERSGTLPALALAELCFSGKYTLPQVKKMITGEGGLVAYLGTNSFRDVAQKVEEGDEKAALLFDAFAYNVAKAIGGCAAVFCGDVDAILITGGIAHNAKLTGKISERVKFIAPVKIYPGEDEMTALAMNGLSILTGKEKVSIYE